MVNSLLTSALGIEITRPARVPGSVLRAGSRLVRPINELIARRMLLGALLADQPQTLDSATTGQSYDITPADPAAGSPGTSPP